MEIVDNFRIIERPVDLAILASKAWRNKELLDALIKLPNDKCIQVPVLGRNKAQIQNFMTGLRTSAKRLTEGKLKIGWALKNGQIYLFTRQ